MGDGQKTRPIGIPAFEDKVLQRAVAMVLEAFMSKTFRIARMAFGPSGRRTTVDLTQLRAILRQRGAGRGAAAGT
jgi:RNA-directed DNA polymerase